MGLGVQYLIVLMPLDMCCPSLELCAFNVNRTRCGALLYVGLGVQSLIVRVLSEPRWLCVRR